MSLVTIDHTKIDPDKYYSAKKLSEMKVFPWISSYHTLKKWITDDILYNENAVFKTIKKGIKTGTRYLIKGSTVIEIYEKTKPGYDFTSKET